MFHVLDAAKKHHEYLARLEKGISGSQSSTTAVIQTKATAYKSK